MAPLSILEKLSKIKAHADSAKAIGSEAEAEAFASMLQKMLLQHKLEISDLDFQKEMETESVEKHYIDYSLYPDIKLRRSRVHWIECLGSIVAEAHFCQILVYPNSSRISLVGRKSDIAVAEYMFITLQRLLNHISDKKAYHYKLECNRKKIPVQPGYRETYLAAFLRRLHERYKEEEAAQNQSTALVRFSSARKDVEDFLKAQDVKKASELSNRLQYNRAAHSQGITDANNFDLHGKALGSNSQSSNLLR